MRTMEWQNSRRVKQKLKTKNKKFIVKIKYK